eukprot:CAMPEP_0118668770 /NCGR_PEP_ID=MMETSP0785-20121206/20527_1 /TAXON_ID=91992 /ORGANISM="Bolidomonas pacifica, Strain CCMP 1866" /LENGTH=122 /DNA_ID=CAMNT_0006563373 /DNA_START=698 /DNA_END=1066 /DNA_ORIENTATION=+
MEVLEDIRRERERYEVKKSKKKRRKRDNDVFTVKDVQRLVDSRGDGVGDDDGDEDGGIRDLLKSEIDGDFELIDDPPPPFSNIQLDDNTVDAGELMLQVLVGMVEPFPKKEGSEKINLTFDC